MSEPKPAPSLTEDQRTEVRQLLQKLSAQSTARASRRGSARPSLKKTKKLKRQPNPFDGIEDNKTVNGVQLAPDCVTLPFIQRTRVVLLPFHLDQIFMERSKWITMMKEDCGLDLSEADAGTQHHLRFVIEANPPVKYLHLYLEKDPLDSRMLGINNWLYAT